MSMYYLNPATGKYELQGAPHVDAYSKEEVDALIAAIPKGVEMELLWENASPTSNFAKQTVELDLSEYDSVMVLAKVNTAAIPIYLPPVYITIGGEGMLLCCWRVLMRRQISSVTTTSVVFDDSYSVPNYSTTEVVDNSCTVPYQIYGIKGVKTT